MFSKIIFGAIVIYNAWIKSCWAFTDDGHYGEEDDATVLPIVLPIVLVVAFACIFGCCWQGKKCPCNKSDDKQQKKSQDNEDKALDAVVIRKETRTAANRPSMPARPSGPPSYAAVTGERNKPLPGSYSNREHRPRTQQNGSSSGDRQVRQMEETRGYGRYGSESGQSHAAPGYSKTNGRTRRQGDEYPPNRRDARMAHR